MTKSHLSKINLIAFGVLLSCVFIYIFYKATHVPVTHDELGTIFFYSKYSYWDIMMYPDSIPNNHILNTLMVKPLILIFGIDELVVRMPNILSFLLYAFGAYRIIISVLGKTSLFFIPASILFVMNPYLLDFFGLCRGYGISLGFVTLSLSYLITSFKFSYSRHLWFALIFSCFASYANFTSLIFWATACLFVLLYYLINRKGENQLSNGKFGLMILLGLGYAALILNPILKMQNDDQFRFWTSNGFVEETVKSLVHNGVYGSRIFLTVNFISYFCMIIFALHLIILIAKFIKSTQKLAELRKPVYSVTIVLLLTIVINILQTVILKTPNLNGRTALLYYPLFIATVLTMSTHFKVIHATWIKLTISIIISFFGIHHLFHTATPKKVREWSYDAYTMDALRIMKKHSSNESISICTHWLFNPSFYYHTIKDKQVKLVPYSEKINPSIEANYFYVHDSLLYNFDSTFITIKRFEEGNIILYKTKN